MTDRPEALRRLDPLVGTWEVTVTGDFAPEPLVGTMTCEWLEGRFLVQRTSAAHAPSSVVLIGVDDTTEAGTVLYTDDRGVHRLYQLSMTDGVWRQWRDAPGFAQRFTGTFDGPDTIHAKWEMCRDGETWTHDFDMTYRRRR